MFFPHSQRSSHVLGSGVLINFCRFPSGTGISVANAAGESISQADCVSQWPSWCVRLVVYSSAQVMNSLSLGIPKIINRPILVDTHIAYL